MAFSIFKSRTDPLYIGSLLALIAGFILTIISSLELCTQSCGEAHHYRFYGLPFELFGILFFITMILLHSIIINYPSLITCATLLLAAGIGSETMMILVQKFQIGSWCPICLSIASSVALTSAFYAGAYLKSQRRIEMSTKSGIFSFMIIGFLFCFFGIGKVDQLKAEESSIVKQITFGDKTSPIEVYFFTDWLCPACKKVEPNMVKMAPAIMDKAQLTFVDYTIHPESLNFTPFNLALMIYNPDQYLKVREILNGLSLKTTEPTDDEIAAAIAPLGIKLKELQYSQVVAGINYFERLGKNFKVGSTPTVVIYNSKTKKEKLLRGDSEITEAKILKTIQSLQ